MSHCGVEYGVRPGRVCVRVAFDKSEDRSRRFRNSPFGIKPLQWLIFRSPKVYEQKTFKTALRGIWARVQYLKAGKSGNCMPNNKHALI